MRTYTFSEARQNFAAVLSQAKQDGEVIIKRRDGSTFVIKPLLEENKSPLDVPGIDLGISAKEIVEIIRETRER